MAASYCFGFNDPSIKPSVYTEAVHLFEDERYAFNLLEHWRNDELMRRRAGILFGDTKIHDDEQQAIFSTPFMPTDGWRALYPRTTSAPNPTIHEARHPAIPRTPTQQTSAALNPPTVPVFRTSEPTVQSPGILTTSMQQTPAALNPLISPALNIPGPHLPSLQTPAASPTTVSVSGRIYEVLRLPTDFSDAITNPRMPPGLTMDVSATVYLCIVAEKYMEHIGQRQSGVKYILERLPDNYVCGTKRHGPNNALHRWLFGHPSGKFDSAAQFSVHFNHLMDNSSADGCSCVVCAKPGRHRSKVGHRDETLQKFKEHIPILLCHPPSGILHSGVSSKS